MDELEKQSAEQTAQPLDTVKKEGEKNPEVCEGALTENDNPCEVDSSPALDIAEAADEIMAEEKEEAPAREEVSYHHMTGPELKEALKAILDSGDMERHKEVAAIRQAFNWLLTKKISDEQTAFIEAGNAPEAFSATPDPDESEIKELLAEFRERRNAYLEAKEEEKKKNLDEKNRIIDEIKVLSDDIDNINLHYQKFQQLQQDFKAVGEVPASSDAEVWKAYQTAVEQFYDRLKLNKELRDFDFKKNLETKTRLIEKAEALAEVEDPVEAFKTLQALHQQWRETGPVSREIREEIWDKFKQATTVINKRHQDYFQERKAGEQANEEAKKALCEKVEAINFDDLHNFNDWDNATKEILALQKEWKEVGFASRKADNQLFNRFRKTCDTFFTSKAEFFRKLKEESKENLAKKEALCEKAEALLEKATEKDSLAAMQEIQKEWRTIGVVRRKLGDEIWKRFCAAVDAFYDARKSVFSGKREEENANLAVKKEIIEELRQISDDDEREDVVGRLRELRDKWQETGFVPFKHKDAINTAYKEELDRIHKAFDLRENKRRINKFRSEVKNMEGDGTKIGKEKERLLRAIEQKQNELKTIENNIGFFKLKSNAGNSMLKDFDKKIEKIKADIAEIQEKIKVLDTAADGE